MRNQTWLFLAPFFVVTLMSVASSAQARAAFEQSQSFTVSKGGTLEVSVRVGDIRISTWEKDEVLVRAEGIDQEYLDRLKMTQTGNIVRVEYRPPRNHSGRVLFEINVPSQFDLHLRTSGGDIDIHGTLTGYAKGATAGVILLLPMSPGRLR